MIFWEGTPPGSAISNCKFEIGSAEFETDTNHVWKEKKMIIDVHTHFRAKGIFEELIKRGLTRIVVDGEGKRHVYDGDYYRHTMPEQYVEPDIEKRVAYLDQHGIDIQVLSTPHSSSYPSEHAPEIARMTNDGLARVVKKYPKRFMGLASVPIRNKEKSFYELDRAVNELGMKGICIDSNMGGISLDSEYLWPFYKKVAEMDLPLFVHPGFPAGVEQYTSYGLVPIVGYEFDLILAQAKLIYGGVLEEFPTLKFIFSHLGGGTPFLKGRIENGWKFAQDVPEKKTRITKPPSTYLEKLYFESVSFYKPAMMCAIQCSGVDKILFGTDYPLYPLGDIPGSLKMVRELDLCASDKEKILGGNAKKLFKIS
jgi:aminocarboxymuconate-semialdehyde decarboxylase